MDELRFVGLIRYWKPERAGGLAVAEIPPELVAPLGGVKQVRVRGTINGRDFVSSAMPAGGGLLALSVSKAMMTAAGVGVGDRPEFTISSVGRDQGP